MQHNLIYRKRRYRALSRLLPTWCLRRKARRGYLARVASELARGRFLDIGCGVGIATLLYGRLGGALSVGVDVWVERLAIARVEARRHRSGARFVRGSVHALPFPGASFDTVYLGQILEHLADPEAAVGEAERVLRPGGRLVISVPDRDLVPAGTHVRTYDGSSLRALFSSRGYRDVCLHPYDDRRLVCSGTKPPSAAPAARCASFTT